MKEFEVIITEKLAKAVTVEASTREEAQAMVEEMWNKGDVVLSADDFADANFQSNDGQEIGENKCIEVLLVQPGQYARMETIGADLKSMQKVVGGSIQEAFFFLSWHMILREMLPITRCSWKRCAAALLFPFLLK